MQSSFTKRAGTARAGTAVAMAVVVAAGALTLGATDARAASTPTASHGAHGSAGAGTTGTAKKLKNADILGMWSAGPGESGGTVYTSESATGRCRGTTPYGAGYSLQDCKVTGDKLTYVVVYETSYKSYNTDTVTGNTLKGSFHDTNGTMASYTDVRVTNIPTTTTISCKAAGKHDTTAACGVTVTYASTGDLEGAPTGKVVFAGKFKATSCKLLAGKKTRAETAHCTSTLTPTKRGRTTLAVAARYVPAATFRTSTRSTKVKVR